MMIVTLLTLLMKIITQHHNGNPPRLNSFRTDNGFNSKLKETLKSKFLENIERFQTLPLKERPYCTKITRKPSENEIRIIDNIANEYATNLKSDKAMLDYWDIYVMHYTVAITLKNYLGDLQKTKQKITDETRMDKKSRTENSITKT